MCHGIAKWMMAWDRRGWGPFHGCTWGLSRFGRFCRLRHWVWPSFWFWRCASQEFRTPWIPQPSRRSGHLRRHRRAWRCWGDLVWDGWGLFWRSSFWVPLCWGGIFWTVWLTKELVFFSILPGTHHWMCPAQASWKVETCLSPWIFISEEFSSSYPWRARFFSPSKNCLTASGERTTSIFGSCLSASGDWSIPGSKLSSEWKFVKISHLLTPQSLSWASSRGEDPASSTFSTLFSHHRFWHLKWGFFCGRVFLQHSGVRCWRVGTWMNGCGWRRWFWSWGRSRITWGIGRWHCCWGRPWLGGGG